MLFSVFFTTFALKSNYMNIYPLNSTQEGSYGVESLGRFNLFSSIGMEIYPEEGYSTGDVIRAIAEVSRQSLPQGS